MSPLLQKILQEIDQLPLAEQFDVINYIKKRLKQQTANGSKLKWLDLAGTAPYPLMGEDAQVWVTRNRQEDQAHRDRLLGQAHEG